MPLQINHFCFKRYCRYCINIYRSYISESSLCQKLPVCISVCVCLYVLYMLAVHSSWVSKITLTRLQLWLSVCHWCVKSCRCLSVWPIAVLAYTPTHREQRGHAKSNREALFLHCAGVWLRLIVFRSVKLSENVLSFSSHRRSSVIVHKLARPPRHLLLLSRSTFKCLNELL